MQKGRSISWPAGTLIRNVIFLMPRSTSQEIVRLFNAYGIQARSQYVNFVFVECVSQHNCQDLHGYLEGEGFLTSQLTDYGLDTCLRISFGSEDQMTRLCNVLRKKLETHERH